MSEVYTEEFDLVIVGAGMVGSALAVFLRHSNLKVALIESYQFNKNNTETSFDDRNLVLSLASKNILQNQNLWQKIQTDITPIKKIHITEENRFGNVILDAKQLNLDALAFSLKAKDLGTLLHNELENSSNLKLICPAIVSTINQKNELVEIEFEAMGEKQKIKSHLLVLADGSNSNFREQIGFKTTQKNYHQHAIVSNVQAEINHNFTAYERFSSSGPFALLPRPAANEFGMVFCVNSDEAEYYLNLAEKAFLKTANKRFGRRLGKFTRLGTRKAYPLKLVVAEQQYIKHIILLGNSSHTIHPNAAQGFNLGLRDVAVLAEQLTKAINRKQNINDSTLLDEYVRLRKQDQDNVIRFTDGIASLFYNDDVIKKSIRSLTMASIQHIPVLKHSLMIRATGLYGEQATMVKQ